MTYQLAYWIIMLVWVLFGFLPGPTDGQQKWRGYVPNLLLIALFVLIGLQVFGKPLHQ
jgi:hypothetical protein